MSVKYYDGTNSVDIAGGITTAQVNEAIQDSRELDYSNTTHLTVDTTNKTFTADGIFIFSDFYISSSDTPYFEFYIEDVCVQISNAAGANIRVSSGTFPVRSGMKYKYALGGTGTIVGHSGTFIPYKVI